MIADNIIKEIEYELQSSFLLNKNLEPTFWPLDDKLNPAIRKKLIKIAKDFFDGLDVNGAELKDITFTGSLANYNWSPYSDIDLHLIVDFKDVNDDIELVREYFNAKKSLWNRIHDIHIDGYEVEVYVQNEKEPHISSGVYSVLNDEWIIKPSLKKATFDWADIAKKTEGLMDQIDRAKALYMDKKYRDALNYIDKLKEKIRKFRKSGLDRSGEFSSENIAFKVLRRNGYLETLSSLKHMTYDRMMSSESDGLIRIKISESVKKWKDFLVEG
jgi:hypothetical protein